ncbi:unnamed protein product [Effrenium voratum]|uniref:Uncharacterized protein n=1 Tax=Effrenium voratum TaxID=2562239 RepID=A0AA36MLH9_9DINO|nr:unnamed protein product [Effrenium voratum]CAJ1453984.1 unnamed protein product [Effrenium voratum]
MAATAISKARADALLTELSQGFGARSFQRKIQLLAEKSECGKPKELAQVPGMQSLAKRVYCEVFQRYGFSSDDSLVVVLESLLAVHPQLKAQVNQLWQVLGLHRDEDWQPGAEMDISQLTVSMVSEVLAGDVLDIRSSRERQLLRLGNTGTGTPEAHSAAAKSALEAKVLKQMIWWKAAPEDVQRRTQTPDKNMTVADVWTLEGEHIPSHMVRNGHLLHVEEYPAQGDILSVAAAHAKREQLRELQAMLTETEGKPDKPNKPDKAKNAGSAGSGAVALALLAGVFVVLSLGVWKLSQQAKRKAKST